MMPEDEEGYIEYEGVLYKSPLVFICRRIKKQGKVKELIEDDTS
jgi:hypothetical protein